MPARSITRPATDVFSARRSSRRSSTVSFSGTPRQIRWYYEELAAALRPDLPPRLAAELADRLEALRRFVDEASPKP